MKYGIKEKHSTHVELYKYEKTDVLDKRHETDA
jgi:hypothetical protein